MGLWPFVLPVNEGGAKCGPGAAQGFIECGTLRKQLRRRDDE